VSTAARRSPWSEATFAATLFAVDPHGTGLRLRGRAGPARDAFFELLGSLAGDALMYTVLWLGGLPAGLRGPVAAYVVVIALMAAQALGRASARGDRASVLVAVGACCFMLSDTLLALNRFVTPLPMAQLGVLATYYVAQCLMVGGLIRSRPA